ncbi:MAG TPA: metalloregulator ArsR/SmtB family transcription factor [Isosphaeraceae bacterium]|nr:metalloregulator ArsR/SmtB family transcription factor [Isosphaeraceae bacterium]
MRPPTDLEESTRVLKAFADPVRLRLLNLLSQKRETCVCHLHEALGLPQPTVSRHLAYLRKTGLVVGRKDGLWVHYRLARPRVSLHRVLLQGISHCLASFEVLREDRERLTRVVSCDGNRS